MKRGKPLSPGCGKRRFKDEIAAKLALASAQRADGSRRAGTERRVYFHSPCGGWHLTAAKGAGRRSGKIRSQSLVIVQKARNPLKAKSAPKTGAAPRKPVRDTGPSRLVRHIVLERDGYACVCCGRSVIGQTYSLQHRKRRSQGGTNALSNLLTVLGDGTTGCHERIDSRRDPHDEAKGYTVRSHDDPAQVPVMYFSPGGSGVTVWLAEDGSLLGEAPEEAA